MSHTTCCCSASLGRCDRCDLLIDLEGFHLIAVARRESGLVLDIESCDRLAGCPGCGVIAQGHGRVVVEVVDAPWAGIPARIRWHKRRWICRERTCQIVTFTEQNRSVCAPRELLGVRAIRWAIRQLRFEGATIAGLARQLGTTWNTVWSHIKPFLQGVFTGPPRRRPVATWPQSVVHGPARVPPDPLLHAVRSLQGTTRRAAAAPRRTRTALGEEAALGALEDFAESDPGPAAPRRWRRGRGPRPVHAVPGASRPRGAASCLPHWRGRRPLHQRY